MKSPNIINIEREFTSAVRGAGGDFIEDLLPKTGTPPKNADYLFRNAGVVAELKCLEQNSVIAPDFVDKLWKLYGHLMSQGRVPRVIGKATVSLRDIAQYDEAAAHEFVAPYKNRLQAVIKAANHQIKTSAKYFEVQQPKGLLLLANDGELALELGLVEMFFNELFQHMFSAINTVVYFTENVTLNVPGIHPAARIWIPYVIPNRPPIDSTILTRLYDSWKSHVAAIRKELSFVYAVGENEVIRTEDVTFTDAEATKLRAKDGQAR